MIRDRDGREWGTAAQLAARLGADVTPGRIRDWARRSRTVGDPLYGRLPSEHQPGRGRGTTWHPIDAARQIERDTRLRTEQHGGPPRALRAAS